MWAIIPFHPMREDVKAKTPPRSPVRGSCLSCIQPNLGGSKAVGWLVFLERASARGGLYLVGFMFPMVVRRPWLVKLRKQECWLRTTCQP